MLSISSTNITLQETDNQVTLFALGGVDNKSASAPVVSFTFTRDDHQQDENDIAGFRFILL